VRTPEEGEYWVLLRADVTSATLDDAFETPRELALLANFPNPFATTTTVGYTLPEAMPVTLEVYDLLGRRVALLVDGNQEAGTYSLTYDATGLGAGVYLLRMLAGGTQHVRRLVVVP
jgi:hypothetical protein